MPSFTASLAGFVLRTTGYYRRMFTGGPQFQKNITKVRAAPFPEPTAKSDLDVRHSEFQGRPVWHIAPKDLSLIHI
jgi:monoterpene epsilon-lactone hydrolase